MKTKKGKKYTATLKAPHRDMYILHRTSSTQGVLVDKFDGRLNCTNGFFNR